jgi:hypothetical protein
VDTSNIRVVCYESDSSTVSILPIYEINETEKTVTVKTNHFPYIFSSKNDEGMQMEIGMVKIPDGKDGYNIGVTLKVLGENFEGLKSIKTVNDEYEHALEYIIIESSVMLDMN